MLTKEQARDIVEEYLKFKKRKYTEMFPVDKISYWDEEEVLYGKHKGEKISNYTIGYGVVWGSEVRASFVFVASETGEVLYSMNSHGWIEELEDE